MVILWRRNSLSLNLSFISKGFVGINVGWKGEVYSFVNVYAACPTVDRINLWRSLVDRKQRSTNE